MKNSILGTSRAGIGSRAVLLYSVTAVVSVVTFAFFLPALGNRFVNLDDAGYVYNNAKITHFDLKFILWSLTTFKMYNYHPLTWISLAADFSLWGKNPLGFHLTNIVLHSFNTFLVILVAARLYGAASGEDNDAHYRRTLIAAGAAGLIFGLHPLRVESVAWISERKDVLYAFFYLLAVHAYLRYASVKETDSKRIRHYCAALFFFICSLLSKPMAVTLPAVLVILDFYPLRRFSQGTASSAVKRSLFEKAPFLLLSLLISWVTILAQRASGQVRSIEALSLHERLLTAVRSLYFYFSKFFWPERLAPFYPLGTPVTLSSRDIVPVVFLLCASAACIWKWRWRGPWAAAWGFYVVALLPVIGAIQVGGQAAADRYTYLPLLGPAFLAGLCFAILAEAVLHGDHMKRAVAAPLVLLISAPFAVMPYLTVNQIRMWKDSISLWSREIALYPFNVAVSYSYRASAFFNAGDYRRAISDYSLALALDPQNYRLYCERGMAYLMSEMNEDAVHDFDTALRINPACEEALFYRRAAYRRMRGNTSDRHAGADAHSLNKCGPEGWPTERAGLLTVGGALT
jgi:hypothetical protein